MVLYETRRFREGSQTDVQITDYTFRPCAVDVRFRNIGYDVKVDGKPKTILRGLNGSFQHGKLHCIMGPSGAGKSSLLNVLAGFNSIANGDVIVNGDPIPANKCQKTMKSISCYIMQDDFLVLELTVRESLTFATKLKCPSSMKEEERRLVVDDLLRKMALADVADRNVWKLSGGQKKRVAVAVEIINYPPVLFLDEPTSGLDSTSCYRLVELLKAVASVGCNVIATIHQPNSRVFRMFDTLYVLATGGRQAYDGPPMALTRALENVGVLCGAFENPADILFERDNIAKLANIPTSNRPRFEDDDSYSKMSKDEFDPLRLKFRLSNFEGDDTAIRDELKKLRREETEEYVRSSLSRLYYLFGDELVAYCQSQKPNPVKQFFALLHRTILQARRDKVFLAGRFVAFLVMTVLFGSTFQFVAKEAYKVLINIGYIYLLTMLPLMATAIVTMLLFPVNFNILLREHINSWYSLSAFYLTRAIVDISLLIVATAAVVDIMWLISGQGQWAAIAVPMVSLIVALFATATHFFCYIIAMIGDEQSLPYLPFSVCMLHTILSGFMIPVNAMPGWLSWTQYVFYGQFAYRALMRVAYVQILPPDHPYGGPVKLACGGFLGDLNPLCALKNGDMVLEYIKIYPWDCSVWMDILGVACYMVFFFIMGWILLGVRLRSAKKAVARA